MACGRVCFLQNSLQSKGMCTEILSGIYTCKAKKKEAEFSRGRCRTMIQVQKSHSTLLQNQELKWPVRAVWCQHQSVTGPPRSWPRGRYCSIPLTTQTVFSPLIWNVTLKIYEVICFSISGAQTLVFLFLWYWLNSSKM